MKIAARTQSFTQTIEDFRASLDWLREIGIRTNRGRLRDYADFCLDFERARVSGAKLVGGLIRFVEIERIVEVWRMRRELVAVGDLEQRLCKAVGGRELHGADRDHTARNFLFELSAACWLLRCGLTLTATRHGDIAAERLGRRFAIECKRPASSLALAKRIKEASKQIERRRSEGRLVGIVLVDFTLLLNPEGQYWQVADGAAGNDLLDEYLDDKKEWLYRVMIPQLRSRDDAFVGCYFWIPCWDTSANSWAFCDRWLTMGNDNSSTMAAYWYGIVQANYLEALATAANPPSSSDGSPG